MECCKGGLKALFHYSNLAVQKAFGLIFPAFFALCATLIALCSFAEAQQAKKMARIGYLSPLSGPRQTLDAFKEGLRDLGWVEGKQVEFEYRYAGGDVDKLSAFATELVRLKVGH
jgi:putative ABC transport system substrate-binding protein